MQACARQQLILILKWRTTHCTGVRQKGASYYNLGNCVPDYVTKRAEVTPIVWNLCPSTPCIIVIFLVQQIQANSVMKFVHIHITARVNIYSFVCLVSQHTHYTGQRHQSNEHARVF